MQALEKIDPHHHLWNVDENPYPWLTGPVQPRVYGDYSAIMKNYLIEDFLADATPHNIVKSVHVQANWDASDPVSETRWLQDVAHEHGFPHAIVAHADLCEPDVAAVLEAHAESPNMRGIRHIVGHTDDPECQRRSVADNPAFARGYAELDARGMSFDLQVYPPQMPSALAVVKKFEDTPFVVCHTGFPFDRSREGRDAWRKGMRMFAELPRAHAKLSGPCMVMPDWNAENFADFIHETIDLFGPERCMFASNVPPDLLAKSYDEIYQAFYVWAARYTEAEARHLFHDAAAGFYRI